MKPNPPPFFLMLRLGVLPDLHERFAGPDHHGLDPACPPPLLRCSPRRGRDDLVRREHERNPGRMRLARPNPDLSESLRDVDLFLTVARNLFAGAGAPAAGPDPRRDGDPWNG